MSQEERAALTEKTTQRLVACLHQTESVEQMIRSMLTGSGIAMFAVGGHTTEEWISRTVASLLIPMFITCTLPEGEGAQEPIVASHWHIRDLEGDAVTCASGLEQALPMCCISRGHRCALLYRLSNAYEKACRGTSVLSQAWMTVLQEA